MSSFDTRNNSALMKRAEQLKRWEESDTNRELPYPKSEEHRKIKFSSGCVFLAACLSGDKEEVVNLIDNGADINTANVDGLTALHQACIDDNLEMVEFLIEHGADINRQDNEGWTPLHATASCGFVSIARYLVENGADLTAVNSDGDLPLDIAHRSPMVEYMQNLIEEYNIECEQARKVEEQTMLSDAKKWLRSDASDINTPHPKTGATALHVAAAKGYTKVMSLLLAGRANVDAQDNDGWTPLHAAAHWSQKEAAQMIVDSMADMEIRNYSGQTCIDVADRKMIRFLEELRDNNKRIKRRPSSQIGISDTIESRIENTIPNKLIRVEVQPENKPENGRTVESDETDSELTDSTESSHSTSVSETEDEKTRPATDSNKSMTEIPYDDTPWRRSGSNRSRSQTQSPSKLQSPEADSKSTETDVILRRTQSFENDDKFYQKYNELRARIKANSCPILPASQSSSVLGTLHTPNQNYSVQRSASLKDHKYFRKPMSPPASPSTAPAQIANATNAGQLRSSNTVNEKCDSTTKDGETNRIKNEPKSKLSPGNIFKNFFKSFVPPVRDEESETQRKAHAKRVRETRRSTQGVTLDEIKSAEELVKKKNLGMNNNNISTEIQNIPPIITTTTTTATPSASVCILEVGESLNKESAIGSSTSEEPSLSLLPTIIPRDQDDTLNPSNELQTKPAEIDIQIEETDNTENNAPEIQSQFLIENENPISLEEHIRNEVNKCFDDTLSNNEVSIICEQKNDSNTVMSRKCSSTPSSPQHQNSTERRPSWRLKFDTGSKFKLEDSTSTTVTPSSNNTLVSAPAVIAAANLSSSSLRRNNISNSQNSTNQIIQRPVSAPVTTATAVPTQESSENAKESINNDTSSTRRFKNSEDKENEKENESRSSLATQAVIQRRRKPKRRSTGVVNVDIEEIDPGRQEAVDNDDDEKSGNEKTSRSRLSSLTTSSANDVKDVTKDSPEPDTIDYKALWEAAKLENDKLKQQLKKKDDEVAAVKTTVDRFTNATTKNSLSELEKRERRALERKLSEMEEELKQLEAFKTENQRLKEENGALIRVISKLSK